MRRFLKRRTPPTGASLTTGTGLLSGDDLAKRLARYSPDLVEEVAKVARDALASENARESSLNGKATSLLTASGLSLTVAFTFGGMLLQHPEYLDSLNSGWAAVVPFLYGGALLCGLAATGFALGALFVTSKYVGLTEANVFDPEVLGEADRLDVESRDAVNGNPAMPPSEGDTGGVAGPPPFPKSGTAYFKRFITAHLWQIYQEHFPIHEVKAKRIWKGQVFFGLFLLTLAVLGLMLAEMSLAQQRQRRAPTTQPPQLSPPTPSPVVPPVIIRGAEVEDGGMSQTPQAAAADAGPSAASQGAAGTRK